MQHSPTVKCGVSVASLKVWTGGDFSVQINNVEKIDTCKFDNNPPLHGTEIFEVLHM